MYSFAKPAKRQRRKSDKTMRFFLTLIALLLWPAFADAQVVKIVRQVCGPFSCKFEIGSGVVIGRTPAANGGTTYRILTVYHVCGNQWDMRVKQWVKRGHDYKMTAVTPAGRFPAQIAAWSGEDMLMLLTIEVPAGSPAIGFWEIADTLPSAGDAVTIHGHSYKRNCEYGARSLTLRLYGPKEFETTSQFEQGESGGPIVKNGKIVGLCEGYDARTKCGLGPSVVAIRWFLGLPPIGPPRPGQQPGLPVRQPESGDGLPPASALSVPRPGSVVPVPPSPAERETQPPGVAPGVDAKADGAGNATTPGGPAPTPAQPGDSGPCDAPLFTPPVHIAQRAPLPEPDPISGPTQSPRSPPRPAANVGQVIGRGMDIWSMLAGAGIVAGTGGVGGLALLAWRGYKAGKVVAGAVHRRRQRPAAPQVSSLQTPPQQPRTPLEPQEANFIEVPVDYRREAVDWALAKHGQKYPGSIPVLEGVAALINQRLQSKGHGPETLHQPPSY